MRHLRHNTWKAAICLMVAAFVLGMGLSAEAALRASDSFEEYSVGDLGTSNNGGTGWANAWNGENSGTKAKIVDVSGNPLSAAGLSGGNTALSLPDRAWSAAYRTMTDELSGGDGYYISYLMRVTDGNFNTRLYDRDKNRDHNFFGLDADSNGDVIASRAYKASSRGGGDLGSSGDYLLVAKIDNGGVTVWLDSRNELSTPAAQVSGSSWGSLQEIGFTNESGGDVIVDRLMIGDTFADVAPPPPTFLWDGTDNNWGDSAHWVDKATNTPLNAVPAASDWVEVQSGKSNVAAPGAVGDQLSLVGGEVAVGGSGVLTIGGPIFIQPSATLSVASGGQASGSLINNQGTIDSQGTLGAATITSSGSLTSSGTLNADSVTSSGTLTNTGALNADLVEITGGTANLGGTGNVTTLDVQDGAVTLATPTIGTMNVTGGTVDTTNPETIDTVNVDGGQVNLGATLTTTTASVRSGAIAAGEHGVTVQEGGSLLTGSGNTLQATSGTFTALGQIDANGVETLQLNGGVTTAITPPPASSMDIGNVNAAGSYSVIPGGGLNGADYFEVTGSGSDIWGNSDEFHYVYRELGAAENEFIIHVDSLTDTNPWAKAGVMIRDSLDANSKHAFAQQSYDNGPRFAYRENTGGGSNSDGGGDDGEIWLRLMRNGDVFEAFQSDNGVDWDSLGSKTIVMSGTNYVGLAVTAHDDGELNTSIFDSVTFLSVDPVPYTIQNLTGTGTLVGNTYITGSISPGNSPGTIDAQGNMTLADGALYEWGLAPVDYDIVNVDGDLTFEGDWVLKLIDDGGLLNGSPVTLFTYTGDLNGWTAPTLNLDMVDPARWNVSQISFDTSSIPGEVRLVGLQVQDPLGPAVPEPMTAGLALLGIAGLITRRRRAA